MPSTPPTRPSIKMMTSFSYRGGTKVWSNRYFFTGDDLTTAQFTALWTILRNEMKQFLSSRCTITEAVKYDAGSDVPVETATINTVGVFVPESANYSSPGDVAALLRFTTDARTAKNHPIYLFKYFHDAYAHGPTAADELDHGQKAAIESFGTDLVAGLSDGTTTRHLCGPRGAVAQARSVNTYLTHRDFPR